MPDDQPAQDPQGEDAAASAASAPEEPTFMNRAARRAKGKGASSPQPQGKGLRAGGRGSVQSPRQYGTRRSG